MNEEIIIKSLMEQRASLCDYLAHCPSGSIVVAARISYEIAIIDKQIDKIMGRGPNPYPKETPPRHTPERTEP
jgi:hypothetical protein